MVGVSCLLSIEASATQGVSFGELGPLTSRPAECSPGVSRASLAFWNVRDLKGDREFCVAMARGYASLRENPKAAVTIATEADRRWPSRDAVRLLLALAQARSGDIDAACRVLLAGGYLESGVRVPRNETVWQARCAWRMGATSTAQEAYRRLLATATLPDSRSLLVGSLLESAIVGMQVGGDSLVGAEANAARAVSKRIEPGKMGIDDGILALALSRQGRDDEARRVAMNSVGPWQLLAALEPYIAEAESDELLGLDRVGGGEPRRGDPVSMGERSVVPNFVAESDGFPLMAPVSELIAVAAILAHPFDPRQAMRLWHTYTSLGGQSSALREHALRMLQTLQESHAGRRR